MTREGTEVRRSEARAHAPDAERAFESLFRSYYAPILTAARNRLGDLQSAEDAAEEAFAAAWRHRAETETVFTVEWLYATLRNVIGNEYRRRKRTTRRLQRLGEEARVAPAVEADDDALTVRRAVSMLRPDDRELIWMAHWEELTRDEMARTLGCSYSAVKVRLLRARQRLKTILNAHFTEAARNRQP